MTATTRFTDTLEDAVDLLRDLPRVPAAKEDARIQLQAFAAAHPEETPEYVIDLAPGAEHADFDIFLQHPDGGTVGITYRDDGGRPWYVDYSAHWAANYVLHVGNTHVTVQEAMFSLQYLTEQAPDLLTTLVRDTLVADAVVSDPDVWASSALDVSSDEVQAAADAFRQKHHLHSAADTHTWLAEMGWSTQRFRSVLASGARVRKMEERLVAHRIDAHFAEHRHDYDLVTVVRVACPDAALAARLAQSTSLLSEMEVRASLLAEARVAGTVSTAYAHSVDAPIRSATPGAVVGPYVVDDQHVVAQVIARQPAHALDAPTRRAVRERLVAEWVSTRMRDVPLRWNWS
jgi:putative peptide maturation system protein